MWNPFRKKSRAKDRKGHLADRTVLQDALYQTTVSGLEHGHDTTGPPVFQPGEMIGGDLLVNRRIDSGQMGYIYLGMHQRYDIPMAVKQPRQGGVYLGRLKKEAETWTRLGLHPNIACCYWVKEIEGWPYIFIEFVKGNTLKEWIRKGKCWRLDIGIDMAVQVCHALSHAHGHNVIHRDIKPENILVDEKGYVKVTDFGLAGAISPNENAHGRVVRGVGTPAYMPPEQWDDFNSVGPAADIFSFGICLWEMILGARPYESTQKPGKPRNIRKLRSDIPPGLEELLLELAASSAMDRPDSADAIILRLNEEYNRLYGRDAASFRLPAVNPGADNLNNQGVSMWELGRYSRARHFFTRALALEPDHLQANVNIGNAVRGHVPGQNITAISSAITSMSESPDSRSVAVAGMPTSNGPGAVIVDIQTGNIIRELPHSSVTVTFSPSGTTLVKGGPEGSLVFLDIETGTMKEQEGPGGTVSALAFSPDGKTLAAGDTTGTVIFINMATGERFFTGRIHQDTVTAICFSSDQHTVATSSRDGSVAKYKLEDPECRSTLFSSTVPVSGLAFVSNGLKLCLALQTGTVLILETETGRIAAKIKDLDSGVSSLAVSPDRRTVAAACENGSVCLIDIRSAAIMRILKGHGTSATAVCFTPDNQYILSGGMDGTIMRFSTAFSCLVAPPCTYTDLLEIDRKQRKELGLLEMMIAAGEIDHAVKRALSGWEENGYAIISPFHGFLHRNWKKLKARELAQLKLITTIREETTAPLTIGFTPDGQQLISGWENGLVHSFDLLTGKTAILISSQGAGDSDLLCTTNGSQVAWMQNSKTIRILRCQDDKEDYRLSLDSEMRAEAMLLSMDGSRLVLSLANRVLVVSTSRPGTQPVSVCLEARHIAIALSPDCSRLACASGIQGVTLYSTSSGMKIKELHVSDMATALSWSANGRYLAAAGSNGITVINMRGRGEKTELKGIGTTPAVLCWSPDGRYIVMGDHNGALFLGRPFTIQELEKIAEPGPMRDVAFSPDSRYLAVAGNKKDTIFVYCLLPEIHAVSSSQAKV